MLKHISTTKKKTDDLCQKSVPKEGFTSDWHLESADSVDHDILPKEITPTSVSNTMQHLVPKSVKMKDGFQCTKRELAPATCWWKTSTGVTACISGVNLVVLIFADCESYCKPVKGNLKINMKKYCKKDYGKRAEFLSIPLIKKRKEFWVFTWVCFLQMCSQLSKWTCWTWRRWVTGPSSPLAWWLCTRAGANP